MAQKIDLGTVVVGADASPLKELSDAAKVAGAEASKLGAETAKATGFIREHSAAAKEAGSVEAFITKQRQEAIKATKDAVVAETELHEKRKEHSHAGEMFKAISVERIAEKATEFVKDTIKEAIKLAEEERMAILRLDSAVEDMGMKVGLTAHQIEAFAEGMAHSIGRSHIEIMRAAETFTQFGSIAGSNMTRAIELSASLAVKWNTDMPSAAQRLGRVLAEPSQALAFLTRSGVAFTEAQKEMIRDLDKSGQVFEAQSLILDKLGDRFGYLAKTSMTGLTGATKTLSLAWEEFLITVGKLDVLSGKAGTLGKLADALNFITLAMKDGEGARASFLNWVGSLLKEFEKVQLKSLVGPEIYIPDWLRKVIGAGGFTAQDTAAQMRASKNEFYREASRVQSLGGQSHGGPSQAEIDAAARSAGVSKSLSNMIEEIINKTDSANSSGIEGSEVIRRRIAMIIKTALDKGVAVDQDLVASLNGYMNKLVVAEAGAQARKDAPRLAREAEAQRKKDAEDAFRSEVAYLEGTWKLKEEREEQDRKRFFDERKRREAEAAEAEAAINKNYENIRKLTEKYSEVAEGAGKYKHELREIVHLNSIWRETEGARGLSDIAALDATARIQHKIAEELAKESDGLVQLKQHGELARDVFSSLGATWNSAFENAILKGRSFREVLSGALQDLARIALRAAGTEAYSSYVGPLVSSFLGRGQSYGENTAFWEYLSSSAVASKAFGGDLEPFRPTIVGENGPERIMATRGGLSVDPNMGGNVQNFVFNVTGGNANENVAAIASQLLPLIKSTARGVVMTEMQPGGMLRS